MTVLFAQKEGPDPPALAYPLCTSLGSTRAAGVPGSDTSSLGGILDHIPFWPPATALARKRQSFLPRRRIEEDAYQEDLGFSLGHLGKAGSGRVRQTQVNEATKARISKTLQRTLQKPSIVYRGKSTIRDCLSGTASSIAFTPLQVGRGLR
ncbi:U4/U6 small nuclear ribonucleoprotein Prp31-like, partial [Neopelma chrysocephalum]|uniref:U4/U6 small nuclear ribonucleoprotein Prp31-like n=1 Tax=Neopelma chrysocephalum TaxID=114329 RepID=UPI000FCD4A15